MEKTYAIRACRPSGSADGGGWRSATYAERAAKHARVRFVLREEALQLRGEGRFIA